MKIGVTSDLHGYLPEIDECELLLICGDISPLQIQRNYYEMEEWMQVHFSEWINNLPCKDVIMVPGNHDAYLSAIKGLEIEQYKSIIQPTKNKLNILYNSSIEVTTDTGNSITIFGTPYCKQFGNWYFMTDSDKLKEYYSEMPENCDIVISHDAPDIGAYGTILEGRYKGINAGNKILAEEIKKKHPKYVFFGHIHSGNHDLDIYEGYGDTKLANVSYLDEKYMPNYKPLYIEI